ncbi:MAG: LytTR family DNA-binding domain-containing protein [Treponema sp.]|nr:LytTR family DNA-binding domain-containing protein [Treponema sp.]
MDENSRIFIIEDNIQIIHQIREYISEYLSKHKIESQIITVSERYESILEQIVPDNMVINIYFLDIILGDETNGLSLAQKIRSKDIFGYIVFITSHMEFAYPAIQYKVRALDYILKSDEEMKRKIFQCLETIRNERAGISGISGERTILIRTSGTDFIIPTRDIIFFETNTEKRSIILHTINKTIEFRSTLDELKNSLDDSFYRCHRSFLINLRHIRSVSKNRSDLHVIMLNDFKCLIAPKYLKKLLDYEKHTL